MWSWYEWNSAEEFDSWHQNLKTALNYPIPSRNQATGEIDESAQWTTDYTTVTQIDNKWIALVEQEHSTLLTPTDLRPKPVEDEQ